MTAVAFSADGKYLASAELGGQVVIWDSIKCSILFRQAYIPDSFSLNQLLKISRHQSWGPGIITGLEFSPTEYLLAWTNADGILSRLRNPISVSRVVHSLSDDTEGVSAAEKKVIHEQSKAESTNMYGAQENETVKENIGELTEDDS